MEFPTIDEFAKEVAEKALDEFIYEGKTIREWVEIIIKQQPCEDTTGRQAAIDELDKGAWGVEWDKALAKAMIESLPSAQPDLIDKIQNGINATNANDNYSCGMRNGMRWCMSLVDDKEPSFEECPSAQPEIIYCKDCKWKQGAECVRFADVRPFPSDFCSRAERRTDD